MGAKGKRNLTEVDFKQLKVLQGAGVKTGMIRKITGRSFGAIAQANRAKDWADYQRIGQERSAKLARKSSKTPVPQEDTALILSKLANIENCLNSIVGYLDDKESNAKVNNWRFGRR